MIWLRKRLLLLVMLMPLALLAACDEGPAENAGEELGNAAEETGEAVDESAEEAGEAAEDAAD